ncbi:MAG: alpha-ketoacid dehydrogenase subunit beta [Nitrospinae bacterium]|nr:alpha-ketoacid dehydrogenase subunit beta [Nitrospinota bacterium]
MPWTKILAENNKLIDTDIDGDKKAGREITYREALLEAQDQLLANDSKVFVYGEGVDDAGSIFGSTKGLHEKYGIKRVFDTPLSESALTGVAVGAALAGMRPILVHMRMDFLLLTLDQIINHAAIWHYSFSGQIKVPVIIRCIVGRGWGSGPQHSQSLEALLYHVPGLRVYMPATPYDAKGLMMEAVKDGHPTIFIEHRWLYDKKGQVPEAPYSVEKGKGRVVVEGSDVTIVATSLMVHESATAVKKLAEEGIKAELIDLRTIKPLDEDIILKSVAKTGKLVVTDYGWHTGGVASSISCMVSEKGFSSLRKPVKRVTCPDIPTPTAHNLEAAYYPSADDVANAVRELCS